MTSQGFYYENKYLKNLKEEKNASFHFALNLLFPCNNLNLAWNKEQYIILKAGQDYLYENRCSKKSKEDYILCLLYT